MGPTTTGPAIQIVNTAIPKFERELTDLTKIKHLPLTLMQEKGRIRTGVDGSYETRYLVDYKECPVTEFAHGSTATYEPRDYTRWAVMDWRGKKGTDSMHEDEVLTMGGSKSQIVNRWKRAIPKIYQAISREVSEDFFVDGNGTSATQQTFHGIESLMGVGTAGNAPDVGDLVAYPDDTYHELSTQVAQGGTWSTDEATSPCAAIGSDWPEGSGDREYHYWSPLLVNWSSNAWGTSQVTWEDNCLRALSRTLTWMRHTQACTGQLVAIMGINLFSGFKQVWEAKTRIAPPHGEAVRLGFPDVLNYEGAMVTTGYGVPSNTVYLFDVSEADLLFLTNKVVVTHKEGVVWDQHKLCWNFLAYNKGDYKFKPKFCAKMRNYAAS